MEPASSPEKGIKKSFFKNLFAKPEACLKTEIEEIIEEHEEDKGALSEENKIIKNVLKFNTLRVADIMTPRVNIAAIADDIALEALKKFVSKEEHTRIPVYQQNLDNIIGFIHSKDLIDYWLEPKEFKMKDILRELPFVAPSMRVIHLLEKMRAERTHMAIVVDEYGGTYGLVTIEDVLEEIVGDIDDEHDEAKGMVNKLSDNVYDVDATLPVRTLEETISRKLADDTADFDTVGGLLFTKLGKVPKIGDILQHDSGATFKVTDADKRRIKRVKVHV
jgi:magnesium and cobalt transporter